MLMGPLSEMVTHYIALAELLSVYRQRLLRTMSMARHGQSITQLRTSMRQCSTSFTDIMSHGTVLISQRKCNRRTRNGRRKAIRIAYFNVANGGIRDTIDGSSQSIID